MNDIIEIAKDLILEINREVDLRESISEEIHRILTEVRVLKDEQEALDDYLGDTITIGGLAFVPSSNVYNKLIDGMLDDIEDKISDLLDQLEDIIADYEK